MQTRSKLALSLLAGVMALPTLFAQSPPPGSGPDGTEQGDGAPPRAQRRGPGQMRGPGGWQRGEGRRGGGRFRGMRGSRRGRVEFALERLAENPAARERIGMTAGQAAKIREETSEFRKGAIRGRAELQVKRLELQDLLRAETPDRSAIDRKIDEISAARLAQSKGQVHYRLAMREILTPEQRQKLRQMREESRGRGFQGGPRPPRGPRGPAPPATQ
jgi:Spy/CpxP family protein refolding chaperone